MADNPDPSCPRFTQKALLEQRERAAAELVKVLAQVKAEIARARELLDRIGREKHTDMYRHVRRPLLPPQVDTQLGSALFNGDENR